jgi:K+-transporting ATPase ATPase C chain
MSARDGFSVHIVLVGRAFTSGRVAKAGGRSEEAVIRLIRDAAEGPDLGNFGEPRVNVRVLNLSLDSEH